MSATESAATTKKEEEEKVKIITAKEKRARKTRKLNKTVNGGSLVPVPKRVTLQRLVKRVYTKNGYEGDLRRGDGCLSALNHYYISSMNKLLSELSANIHRFGCTIKNENGKRKLCSRVITHQHILTGACCFLPRVIGRDMTKIFTKVIETEDGGKYHPKGNIIIPLTTGKQGFKSVLGKCQITNEALIAIASYSTSVLNRAVLAGVRVLKRDLNVMDNSWVTDNVGVGTKTLTGAHIMLGVSLDKPPHTSEGEGFGLAMMFAMDSHRSWHMPTELCSVPMLKRFHPAMLTEEAVKDFNRTKKKSKKVSKDE